MVADPDPTLALGRSSEGDRPSASSSTTAGCRRSCRAAPPGWSGRLETRRKFDQEFKEGAVRIVEETSEPVAQAARELGINEGTLGSLVSK
jgi:transposase-like protein